MEGEATEGHHHWIQQPEDIVAGHQLQGCEDPNSTDLQDMLQCGGASVEGGFCLGRKPDAEGRKKQHWGLLPEGQAWGSSTDEELEGHVQDNHVCQCIQ